jgi:uncharacterized protein (TIGR02466 family)
MTEIQKPTNILTVESHFATTAYFIEKPEFLETAKFVSKEYLLEIKKDKPKVNKLYPVYMSSSFWHDERVRDLVSFIGRAAWNILSDQGHNMDNQEVYFQEMWAQEHYTHSANDEHVHGNGCQITGFYILEAPEDCSMIAIHDPRPAKRQINLPEKDFTKITSASTAAYYQPKPGQLYFLNSWVPHGFTRHGSNKPFKFIHFNLATRIIALPSNAVAPTSNAEVI